MNKFLKRSFVITVLIFISLTAACSQDLAAAQAADPGYVHVLIGRADRIVSSLDLNDPVKKAAVHDAIVLQYYNLSRIQDKRDARIEALKKEEKQKGTDKKIASIRKKADKDIRKLHDKYIAQLSALLDSSRVDKVKDGMTYGVVPITYRSYLHLLPNLTDAQKKKIMEYLVQAREVAMDAGSSEKKHYWFGQYKGKINNYLAANGYDLKDAEQASKERN